MQVHCDARDAVQERRNGASVSISKTFHGKCADQYPARFGVLIGYWTGDSNEESELDGRGRAVSKLPVNECRTPGPVRPHAVVSDAQTVHPLLTGT